MRPEDVPVPGDDQPAEAIVLDTRLEALDAELEAAGRQARRMLNGKVQPTRYFSLELRRRLLEALETE